MATKAEITGAIHEGIARVDGTFGNLTDEQLATKVHDGDNGWTARQILAHLAGREEVYQLFDRMADGFSPFSGGGFDIHAWNQFKVDARADKTRDELLAEFRAVHTALAERVETLSDERLATKLQSPRGESTLGDMLHGSGGTHSVGHAVEVEQALGLGA